MGRSGCSPPTRSSTGRPASCASPSNERWTCSQSEAFRYARGAPESAKAESRRKAEAGAKSSQRRKAEPAPKAEPTPQAEQAPPQAEPAPKAEAPAKAAPAVKAPGIQQTETEAENGDACEDRRVSQSQAFDRRDEGCAVVADRARGKRHRSVSRCRVAEHRADDHARAGETAGQDPALAKDRGCAGEAVAHLRSRPR
jgi:hypothetical protein